MQARPLQGGRREDPFVLADGRAYLSCGCSAFVGFRVDRIEAVTVLRPCSADHDPLIQRVQDRLVASLREASSPRPMLEVVDELLQAEAA